MKKNMEAQGEECFENQHVDGGKREVKSFYLLDWPNILSLSKIFAAVS